MLIMAVLADGWAWADGRAGGSFSQLQEGQDLVALTWNSRGIIGVLNDTRGRILTNDAFVNGARAAGISGSGPAIAALVPSFNESVLRRIEQLAEQRGHDTIVTDLWTA